MKRRRCAGSSSPRRGRRLGIAGVVLLVALGASSCETSPPPGPPSVIYVTWDSVRADHVSAYGYARPTTPTLDRLAREGVLFETAIAQHNWTRPSYSSVLTSRHMWELRDMRMGPSELTLAETLYSYGYRTVGIVQNPNLSARFHFDQGFETYLEVAETKPARVISEAAIERLEPLRAAGQPFFLFVHYQGPHWPYDHGSPHASTFIRDDSTPIGSRQINHWMSSHGDGWDGGAADAPSTLRYIRDLYDSDLRETDDGMRVLFDWLAEHGLWDNTLIAFNSDHGDEFGDRGRFGHAHKNLHPELTYVPLIVRFPKALGVPSRRVAAPVQNLDILPTVLSVLGIPVPDVVKGRSLLPLDSLEDEDRIAFSSVGRYVAVRSRDYTLIVDLDEADPAYAFYAINRDRNETAPVRGGDDNPAFLRLKAAAAAAFDQNAAAPPAGDTAPRDEELLQRLKSLGYVR